MRFRVCTYNIHKGLSPLNLRPILNSLKEFIIKHDINILCLQEVIGKHLILRNKFGDLFVERQFEYIADKVWKEFAYGKNAIYPHGDHGNAILSHYQISKEDNFNISIGKREQRGLLHCELKLSDKLSLACLNTHLNLTGSDRRKQVELISTIIKSKIDPKLPLLLCGDFNDWRYELSPLLAQRLSLEESSQGRRRKFRTFPAKFPLFYLDRIYYKNLTLLDSKVIRPKQIGSDHLPIIADFEVS